MSTAMMNATTLFAALLTALTRQAARLWRSIDRKKLSRSTGVQSVVAWFEIVPSLLDTCPSGHQSRASVHVQVLGRSRQPRLRRFQKNRIRPVHSLRPHASYVSL